MIFAMTNTCEAKIILVGGSAEEAFLPKFVEYCGGKNAKIFVLAAGRESPDRQQLTLDTYRKILTDLGVDNKNIYTPNIMSRESCDDGKNLEFLDQATGILIGAGDQEILMDRLYKSVLKEKIVKKVSEGMVYYGVSCGAMVASAICIRGTNDGYTSTIPGIGILTKDIVDTHFTERTRKVRLQKVIERFPDQMGIGIDERTALIIDKDTTEINGDGRVYIIKGVEKTKDPEEKINDQ
jgi:cyanophycinase